MNLATYRQRPIKNLLFANFSSDSQYFMLGKKQGFSIIRINQQNLQTVLEMDGIPGYPSCKVTAMDVLEKSNLFAFLVGGANPPYDGSRIVIWDAQVKAIMFDIKFECGVHSLRVVRGRLIAIFMTKIAIYDLDNHCEKIKDYDMYWNEHSVIGLSCERSPIILAFPAKNKGQVHCVDISRDRESRLNSFSTILAGHNGAISAISVSDNGQLVATASTNGTLIRVWNARTGQLQNEFRRGVEYAQVYSLAFDPLCTKLAVISEKQTLHFFNVASNLKDGRGAKSATEKFLPKYFSSDWSIEKITVSSSEKCLIKFQRPTEDDGFDEIHQLSVLYVLSSNASLQSMELDQNGSCSVKAGFYQKFKV